MDLGQLYLINNKALVARSSSRILFFKMVKDMDTGIRKWIHYETIDTRGNIYFIKGNVRIQVTTDDMIYFYFIDQKTFVPQLDNVMFNFMGCNQMMFGSRVRYGITYKSNQKSFDIYTRKFTHDFKVPIMTENLEGSKGLELVTMNAFLVSKVDKIILYSSSHF